MDTTEREVATLGGGCFMCLEAVFAELHGVQQVVPGYSGGHVVNPTYTEVATGTTGHAEVVEITFDPTVVTFRDLLSVFFTVHDPTTLNRQGSDVGTQYRSVIFPRSPDQEAAGREAIEELGYTGVYQDPIVTEVSPFKDFYQAEEQHQGFYKKNPDSKYCRLVIAPKVAKLRSKHLARLVRSAVVF